jgi:hypothetical protein
MKSKVYDFSRALPDSHRRQVVTRLLTINRSLYEKAEGVSVFFGVSEVPDMFVDEIIAVEETTLSLFALDHGALNGEIAQLFLDYYTGMVPIEDVLDCLVNEERE